MTMVPGLRIGHATDTQARTGCTVLLGPFRAAHQVCGHATGSRELDVLSALHIVERVDALLLTGGSAFGLAAADGIVAWLAERGAGFDAGVARVPIVPAAVIFDLATGRADRWPDAAMGRAACDAASGAPPAEGAVGAGAGATSGKVAGPGRSLPGGFGCAVTGCGEHRVLAAAVVNPFGCVIDEGGRIIGAAGPLDDAGLADPFSSSGPPGTNTTLAVVATDAPLTREALRIVARMASAAIARRITPAFTPFDGDIVFALSTAPDADPARGPARTGACGAAACGVLEEAILRAVRPSR
jgi:L-aminopeptidase/D-esterase-like protein